MYEYESNLNDALASFDLGDDDDYRDEADEREAARLSSGRNRDDREVGTARQLRKRRAKRRQAA